MESAATSHPSGVPMDVRMWVTSEIGKSSKELEEKLAAYVAKSEFEEKLSGYAEKCELELLRSALGEEAGKWSEALARLTPLEENDVMGKVRRMEMMVPRMNEQLTELLAAVE